MIGKMVKEWKIWRIVRSVAKQNREAISKCGFDVDWIGRIYTVVNIPDEIMELPVNSRADAEKQAIAVDVYVKENMGEIAQLLTDLRIADLVIYPTQYERFEGTNSMLVILAPERYYTKPWKVVFMSLLMGGLLTGIGFLISYLIRVF